MQRRSPRNLFTTLMPVLAGIVAQASAQQPAPPALPSTIKVEVQQVLVPVVVTDRKGHHTAGLQVRDFQVFEDGVPQHISAFSTEQAGAADILASEAPAQPSSTTRPPAIESWPQVCASYLICMDALHSAFQNFSDVRSALRKLFKQEQGGGSEYALVALGRQARVVQNVTRDPAIMLAAVNNKKLNQAILMSETANLGQQEHLLSQMLGDYCQQCPCAGPVAVSSRTSGGSDLVCSGKWQKIEMWAASAAQERTAMSRAFFRDLRELMRQLAGRPGRRTLILISDGFNLQPGRDLFAMMAAYARDPAVVERNPEARLTEEMNDLVREATAGNVAFYALDSRGLYAVAGGGFSASEEVQMTRITVIMPEIQQEKETLAVENQVPLRELADSTGGLFYGNSNDLLKGLRQSFGDGRDYYLLAYTPTNQAADGKFRQIKVEVKGKDLVVRAKRGYWASKN